MTRFWWIAVVAAAACGSASPPAHAPAPAPVRNAAAPPPTPVATPGLTISRIEPDRGDVDGGTYVRITGTRFLADGARNAKVYFGTRQGTVVRFASDTELIVEAPGGKPDEQVDVLVVFEPGGALTLPKAFSFIEKRGDQPTIQDLDGSPRK